MDIAKFTRDNTFLMLALDHRGSFEKYFSSEENRTDLAIEAKHRFIQAIGDQMSGVLIDQKYGLPAYKSVFEHGEKPFLLPIEKSGYTDTEGERITELQHKASDLKELGASGIKLLIYFNPFVGSSGVQIETARNVLADAHMSELPLFLEIVTYESPQDVPGANLTVESLKMFLGEGVRPDVFKLEYPGNKENCKKINDLVGTETPWILLTRGAEFDVFSGQLKDAVESGADGFLAGRALWQDFFSVPDEEKEQFLSEKLPERFRVISDIVFQSREQ